MWPFNQYRVLKIKVTRYIYHKAPDVHIFHIIDEKKQDEKRSRCQSELYKRPPRNRWNSFSVYHHDWNDRTFRHVAANSQKDCYCNHKIRSHFDLFLQFFTVLLSLLLFFFSHNSVFLLSRHQKWKCKPVSTESSESSNHKKINIPKASPRTRSVR